MSKPFRIAFIFQKIVRSGSEHVSFNITRGLQKLGHQVSYYSVQTPKIEVDDDLPKPFVASSCLFGSLQVARQIERDQKRYGKYDLILSNRSPLPFFSNKRNNTVYFLHTDIWASLSAKYPKYPSFIHLFEFFRVRFRILRAQLYYNHQQVIAVSQGAKETLLNNIKARPRHIQTIYNPFDFELIQQLTQAYSVTLEEPYIIHVGRFAPEKRHDLLLNAYKRLKTPPKLVLLTIVTEELKTLIAQNNLTDQVILPGIVDNPFPWMKNAKALILCSDYEGFGNVIVESLMCGTPVISTNCPSGPQEILTGDLAQWLLPIKDPQALADKIQAILDHPYKVESQHYERFDMKVILPQYLALIK